MISRFNYTDRIDLKTRMFNITVKDGPPRTFDIDWNFDGLVLPADARVYVEAMASGAPAVIRYAYGTVAERRPPANGTDISELPGENVHFTVKLVDETEKVGRLVGLAENIVEDCERRRGLWPAVNTSGATSGYGRAHMACPI